MKPRWTYMLVAGSLSLGIWGCTSEPTEDEAIAEIEGYGGTVGADLEKLSSAVGSVGFNGSQITDAGLGHLREHLEGLTSLKRLDLGQTQITDAGLEHLKGLTNLQVLHLWDTEVTGPGLEHLKSLANLQFLSLEGSPVSDAHLVHLKELTSLRELGLAQTQVTDAGLQHLEVLTGLTGLSLSGTQVTDEGVKKLQRALPNCQIIR